MALAARRLLALFALSVFGGCVGADAPARPMPSRAADKAALYGDALAVPTREGERVRREVALAGEIEAAVAVAMDTPHVVADVELEVPPRVAVAMRLPATVADAEASRASVQALARAIVKDADVLVILGAPHPRAPEPTAPARPVAWLLLSLVGLGVSLGIGIERLRLRMARRRRR